MLAPEGVIEIVGLTTTLTVQIAELVQPPLAPITVQVVVDKGDAVTTGELELFNVDAGLQVYDTVPVEVSVADVPEQIIVVEGIMDTATLLNTFIACVAELVHVPLAPSKI